MGLFGKGSYVTLSGLEWIHEKSALLNSTLYLNRSPHEPQRPWGLRFIESILGDYALTSQRWRDRNRPLPSVTPITTFPQLNSETP
ncbi:hypothetical protein N836_09130 [Leptolyngbya sp. Heron Island J]|uniref:hypothetical protein n=1 Tax=Leptolyngbya sp. Heron Island J TaxID=1385935 RepID=UPI0003B9AB97|nr:hypothetical protein [Leptolyngbya sp. Heron Island J]ESA36035.1 hypothetical protein N836_09130 [Leptolyngbya sp. Heron Island J]